jgi:hypothetical protein
LIIHKENISKEVKKIYTEPNPPPIKGKANVIVTTSSPAQFATLPRGVFAITLMTSNNTCGASLRNGAEIDSITYVGRGHGRKLSIGIIRRSYLNDIGRDNVKAI